MQKKLGLLITIILILILSGCGRQITQPTLDLSHLTPAQTPMEESITLTPTPALDPATEQALRLYPLLVGSTWVYEYLGYDQSRQVVWRVVDTVTENRIVEGYFVAVLERSAELLEGDPPTEFPATLDTGTFWYLVDGQNLYRFDNNLFTQLSNAWLDLVLPFPEDGQVWYPDPDLRAQSDEGPTGFRYASDPFKQVLPMGGTYTCYNVSTQLADGDARGTFCETVGFVYQEFNYSHRIFGYRSELREFLIQ